MAFGAPTNASLASSQATNTFHQTGAKASLVFQLAWTFATAVVAGFGTALGWRKGTQADEPLDLAGSAVSAAAKQKMERTAAKLQGQSDVGGAEAAAS